jgi:HAMP domain-containing protein
MKFSSRDISLKWKIGGMYAGLMLALSILALVAVYYVTQHTLQDQLDKRALLIATNFSDAAAGHLASKNLLALHTLARKFVLLDGVAYAFVKNTEGDIIAHTLGAFPDELRTGLSSESNHVERRTLELNGRPVYETAVPVLEGQLGIVHVGFWADAVRAEIHRAVLPIIGIVAAIPLLGGLASFFVAQLIVRPIVGLTKIAEKITKGDLETPVLSGSRESRDEIGELARSLERMRSSLKAAMTRLAREVA